MIRMYDEVKHFLGDTWLVIDIFWDTARCLHEDGRIMEAYIRDLELVRHRSHEVTLDFEWKIARINENFCTKSEGCLGNNVKEQQHRLKMEKKGYIQPYIYLRGDRTLKKLPVVI